MKHILFVLAFISVLLSAKADNNKPIDIEITSVSVKNDDNIIRLTANLIGYPHTAYRIDRLFLSKNSEDGCSIMVEAIDIDGIDFKRYFQWEDEGIITVEIDFPADGLSVDDINKCIFLLETNLGPIKVTHGKS